MDELRQYWIDKNLEYVSNSPPDLTDQEEKEQGVIHVIEMSAYHKLQDENVNLKRYILEANEKSKSYASVGLDMFAHSAFRILANHIAEGGKPEFKRFDQFEAQLAEAHAVIVDCGNDRLRSGSVARSYMKKYGVS